MKILEETTGLDRIIFEDGALERASATAVKGGSLSIGMNIRILESADNGLIADSGMGFINRPVYSESLGKDDVKRATTTLSMTQDFLKNSRNVNNFDSIQSSPSHNNKPFNFPRSVFTPDALYGGYADAVFKLSPLYFSTRKKFQISRCGLNIFHDKAPETSRQYMKSYIDIYGKETSWCYFESIYESDFNTETNLVMMLAFKQEYYTYDTAKQNLITKERMAIYPAEIPEPKRDVFFREPVNFPNVYAGARQGTVTLQKYIPDLWEDGILQPYVSFMVKDPMKPVTLLKDDMEFMTIDLKFQEVL
jgi:hypothetical protein